MGILGLLLLACTGCAADAPADTADVPSYYEIVVPQGRMVVRLYDDTPGHRDNFAKLAEEQFYDSTTFHRVIAGFMIQGGDPNSKNDDLLDDGAGGPGYTIPAEFVPTRFHKRGALAAARQGDQVNPEKRSSGSQFYIVHGGTPYTEEQLAQIEAGLRQQLGDPDFSFPEEARQAYLTEGGAPQLDGAYTVFGELVEGFDVLDAVANVLTVRRRIQMQDATLMNEGPFDPRLQDQPPQPVPMTVRPLPEYTPPSP